MLFDNFTKGMKKLLYSLLLITLALPAAAQEPVKDEKPDFRAEQVIDGKRFKVYNNWLSGGAGVGYNSKVPQLQFVGQVDFNFHIKGNYFQLGLILAGDEFGDYNNSIFHAGYGKRKETRYYNLSAFGGLSFTKGFNKYGSVYDVNNPYKEPGLYFNAQAIKKVSYDVGIGLGFVADVNMKRSLAGVTAIVYFSGAYKGKKK